MKSCIVEGYGRRRYKANFIRFIVFALASNDETLDYLETLFETESMKDENSYIALHQKIELLGKKINNFLQAVEKGHNENKI